MGGFPANGELYKENPKIAGFRTRLKPKMPQIPSGCAHRSMQYRRDIDGLRAVAVIAVVAFHTGIPGIGGGFTGVDVFFVISGFLITGILLKELEEHGRIDFAHFYARRVRRILPNLLLVTTATLLAGLFILAPVLGELQGAAKAALATILIVANHYYLYQSGDYFARPAEFEPLLHTWSLSVEEQFYLVWPALMLGGCLFLKRHDRGRERLTYLFGAVVVVSLVAGWMLASWRNPWAFYLAPARAWELALGGLIALRLPHAPPPKNLLGNAASFIGLAMIAAGAVFISPGDMFPAPLALVPVIGTALVIVGNAWAPMGPTARLLSTKPLVAIGLVSYAWYLWHWPILSLARIDTLGTPNLLRDIMLSALALAISALLLRWFENPLRFAGRSRANDARTIAIGGASACIALLLIAGIGAWAKYGPRSASDQALLHAKADFSRWQLKCDVGMANDAVQTLGPCLASGQGPRVLLWGDSFAGHWAAALEDWAAHQDPPVEIEYLVKSACPPLLGALPKYPRSSRDYTACRAFNELADSRFRTAAKNGRSGVVLSGEWLDYTMSSGATPSPDADGRLGTRSTFEYYLRKSLEAARANGLRVLVVLQSPVLHFPSGVPMLAPECLYRLQDRQCAMPLAQHEQDARMINQALKKVASEFEDVRVFDPAAYLCRRGQCEARIGGVVAYVDSGHIAASMSRKLAAPLTADLDWLLANDRPQSKGWQPPR